MKEGLRPFEAVIQDQAGIGWNVGDGAVFYCFATGEWFGDHITADGWRDMTEDEVSKAVEDNGLDPKSFEVPNSAGTMVNYAAALDAMDGRIVEKVRRHNPQLLPSMFFDAYCDEHLKAFGEVFEYDEKNPQI